MKSRDRHSLKVFAKTGRECHATLALTEKGSIRRKRDSMPKKKKKPLNEELVRIDSKLFKVDGILEEELELDEDLELFAAIEEEIVEEEI